VLRIQPNGSRALDDGGTAASFKCANSQSATRCIRVRMAGADGCAVTGDERSRPPNARPLMARNAAGTALARAACQKIDGGERHHLGGIHHVVYPDPFVGPMRQIKHAGAIGDAILKLTDAVHMLLVIGAG